MTLDPTQINSGVDYIPSDVLPAATVNGIDGNAELAWVNALSAMGPAVMIERSTGGQLTYSSSLVPKVVGNTINRVANGDSILGYDHTIVTADGSMSHVEMTTVSILDVGVIAYSPFAQIWYLFRGLGTTWCYSAGPTMATMTDGGAPLAASTNINAATALSTASDLVLAVGRNGSSLGIIYLLTAGSPSLRYTSPTALQFVDVAASSDNATAVTVSSADSVAYTIDAGVSWTAVALPALPATAVGRLSISWSASSGFLVSGLLSTGHAYWSTSPTGASWQAWRQTAQVAVAPTATFRGGSTRRVCGMCAIGPVMFCPYVTAQPTGIHSAGVMVSVDGGASWRPIEGVGRFEAFDMLRAVPMGNRVAVVSAYAASVSAQAIATDAANSVAS
jgi:hypothetical protein